jgi:proteasome lid subunit RPN8/RPN11
VEVWLHRGQLDYFRAKARNSPNEIYVTLVGKQVSKSAVHILYFIHPKDSDYELSTPSAVTVSADFVANCEQDAKAEDLKVVGSIHTHPNWPPILSPTDHKNHIEAGDKISGIVEVTKGRTRVAFWQHGSALRCTIKYFSKE